MKFIWRRRSRRLLLATSFLFAFSALSSLASVGRAEVSSEILPLQVDADLFTRFEVRRGYDAFGLIGRRLGEGDHAVYRARFGLELPEVRLGSKVRASLFVQPQSSGFWGDTSGSLKDPGIALHQAKTRISFAENWLDIGRFEMAYGEHRVIGSVPWHETGRAFDGLRWHQEFGQDKASLDLFATILREGSRFDSVNPWFEGDDYFVGIYSGVGPTFAKDMELDVYLLMNIAPETEEGEPLQGNTAVEITFGTRAKKSVGPVVLRGEGGLQVGKRRGGDDDVFAYHFDGDAMVALTKSVRFGAGALYASGDDPETDKLENWNQLYPTAHAFLGLMDIIGGRSNIAALTGKVRVALAEGELSFGLDAHFFARPQEFSAHEGFEKDLWCIYKLGGGLSLRGTYGVFIGEVEDESELAHYGELQLRYIR